jgi:putative glutathione S-transferase
MDCLSCGCGGAGPATDSEFLGSICNLTTTTPGTGTGSEPAKFPVEADRYIMYVIAGCPFAARPWAVQALYGLPIKVVKLFPASYEDGWFFVPKSDGEKALVDNFPTAVTDKDPLGHGHLKELYLKANPDFEGAISVPLLWDTKQNTAVSNSSLGLSEMFETQFKGMATRNTDFEMYPIDPALKQEHEDLNKWIHSNVTVAPYKMNGTKDGKLHDELVDNYYKALTKMQDRLVENDKTMSSGKAFLMGSQVRFADIILWISLMRYDLAYQWRFGLGRYSIRDDYPRLQTFVQQILDIEGIKESVYPRDMMALYFMTLKWTFNGSGRQLPQVPHAWESKLGM